MLFIFGGLPGVGKSELALHVAKKYHAMYLRIDTIEQAIRDSGFPPCRDEGYRVAYAVATDNLKSGMNVVADSVNPVTITRKAWRAVARNLGLPCCEIEVICSDPLEHQNRVETRTTTIPGLKLPSWEDVINRTYEKWDQALCLDTAGKSPEQSKSDLDKALSRLSCQER